jgi:hypothetical protein
MGLKVFEELLEQDAITFVQWEPEPMFTHDGKHVQAAFVGRIDDGGPIDVEKRIDQGFLLERVGPPTRRKGVKQKLLRQTSILQEKFGAEAWRLAAQALSGGSFEHLGLPSGSEILGLTVQKAEIVSRAAHSLMIYRHALENHMTAAENEGVFDLFAKVVTGFEQPDLRLEQFGVLAEYAEFPNLRELFGAITNPFQHAAKFRQTRVATTFRAWLSTLGNKRTQVDIIREYVDACKGRKGFFEPRTHLKTASKVAIKDRKQGCNRYGTKRWSGRIGCRRPLDWPCRARWSFSINSWCASKQSHKVSVWSVWELYDQQLRCRMDSEGLLRRPSQDQRKSRAGMNACPVAVCHGRAPRSGWVERGGSARLSLRMSKWRPRSELPLDVCFHSPTQKRTQVLVFKRRCAHSGIMPLFGDCANAEAAFSVSGLLNIDWRGLYVERTATPSSLSISAFCTCSRFSASSIATQLGASRTASVASTLRRTGRQWLKIALLVIAIFPSSTMKRT